MPETLDSDFLALYEKESDWAEGHGISQRTAARYRALGLPFLTFGGWIWIPKREGREWIASRVKRRNPRRQRRQAIPASLNIIAPRAPP
jgi:hypothetical protein